MTISLKIWNNPGNEADVRLYIQGTTRQSLYLKASKTDGRLVWSSKASDTPAKFRTGNHYEKVRKDEQAAHDAAETLGLRLGEDDWELALATAKNGLMVEAR